jgi:1,4-dihydroxy-2-naphthoate octaprenyltransferase
MNIRKWIVAARLRTLPLSLSAVLAGCFLGFGAIKDHQSIAGSLPLFLLIVITAILLQILSNFANDYGDAKSGVDAENRVGPKRGILRGEMTMTEMKKGIIAVTCLCLFFGSLSLIMAFGLDYLKILSFTMLGALSIVAAITYTVGLVYGYKGLGDISVFIFFGLVSVMGSCFMISGDISTESIILGCAAGFMATLVLNVNNLRDYESDRVNGKKSLVVMMGLTGGKIYHGILLLGAICSMAAVLMYHFNQGWWTMLMLSMLPISVFSVFCINPVNTGAVLDPLLKKTSLSAAFVNILSGTFMALF